MIVAYIDLIVLILKAIVLSAVYSLVILMLIIIFFKKSHWLGKRKYRFAIWSFLSLAFFIKLLDYRFSYWEDKGLGEHLIIPIGYDQKIENDDLEFTYFFPNLTKIDPNEDEIKINKFAIENDNLCAEISHDSSENSMPDFIVYNLRNKISKEFKNEAKYIEFAKQNNMPLPIEFTDFSTQYLQHIQNRSKWKKWFLL